LFPDHFQSAFQRLDAVPPELEIVEASRADSVKVRIVESWNDATSAGIDHARMVASQRHHFVVAADGDELLAANGESFGFRPRVILRGDLRVVNDEVGELLRARFSGRAGRERSIRHEHDGTDGESVDHAVIFVSAVVLVSPERTRRRSRRRNIAPAEERLRRAPRNRSLSAMVDPVESA
jgi:hypothetical protein